MYTQKLILYVAALMLSCEVRAHQDKFNEQYNLKIEGNVNISIINQALDKKEKDKIKATFEKLGFKSVSTMKIGASVGCGIEIMRPILAIQSSKKSNFVAYVGRSGVLIVYSGGGISQSALLSFFQKYRNDQGVLKIPIGVYYNGKNIESKRPMKRP